MILERGLGRAVQCMSKKRCKEKVVTFFTRNGNLFGNLLQNKKACKFKTYRLIIVLEADRTGLEPATSAVTGRHSNQLNYRSSNSTHFFKWDCKYSVFLIFANFNEKKPLEYCCALLIRQFHPHLNVQREGHFADLAHRHA